MVSFQTKNPNLGKFWRALDGKMLKYFTAIWNILRTFGIFCDHLVPFVFIWYIFSRFWYHEPKKSGNPADQSGRKILIRALKSPQCYIRALKSPKRSATGLPDGLF
jgi:hypothetical protein